VRHAPLAIGDPAIPGLPVDSDVVALARCWGCGAPLATLGWTADGTPARDMFLAGALVRGPDPHPSGVPRYGPPRHDGKGTARHQRTSTSPRHWQILRAHPVFYVNCHRCQRGQLVAAGDATGDMLTSG